MTDAPEDQTPTPADAPEATPDTTTGETLGGAQPEPGNSASKDPEEWVTGDEPITGPQKSYLDTLAREAGEELSADMTKAEASEHIDRLQQKTGRGA
ncbi:MULTISPECIES: DUF3072 domain-containing protein [unclassified Frondihabitans]|jgi:hypothetical protein|uniref:DUF3072 domain-containing protein n=1 Tax=unclassified Frondihabitans TaxID=2626248 RepID=UPI0006FB63BF|nr:DUF3072 domain-containing protein [Frondihabitans sp. Leaf304]KQQ27777.1 transposase [Frondihabitans sp. Leaf304]